MVADSTNMATPDQAAGYPSDGKRHVETTVLYFSGDPKVQLEPTIIGGPKPPNLTPKIPSPVFITDVTGDEDRYSLEAQGFQFVKHKTKFEKDLPELKSRYKAAEELDEITAGYYEEMKEILAQTLASNKKYPKPSSIHILTHIIRAGPKDGEGDRGPAGPLYGVHVDQSAWAAEGVAERWLGDQAADLLKKPRFQIINVSKPLRRMWRPCKPITRDPFAVSDATSIPDEHIIKVPLIFPDHTAEALEVCPSPDPQKPHRYYYKFNQHPDDVLFFIQVDSSKQPGVPRRCPHVAFKDPNLDESKGEPRVSIETRAMVFYDQDEA
ncbi:hypothetical protein KVR01_013842 [Diaporthe batatas]|uniref:uncharacterized protein n=1 Tax=Diaporthe batatas TaxID=748121 RepID=UPI001D03B195|nr:uncharacterized protein KVR01_013842 [Diaporthe batatas]KAG8156307.1 hypothetical protein KVR01_013842 [Diaporthe batatas]